MKKTLVILSVIVLALLAFYFSTRINFNTKYKVGQKIDSLNGVYVYYNGGVGNLEGRNLSADGYNIGMKYQCVEFVKRYYYQYFNHKMPDSYGNAKDFFDKDIVDGEMNLKKNLIQFKNPSGTSPKVGDLLIYSPTVTNRFGHVSIVSQVNDGEIEIIQQNPGPFALSREKFSLKRDNNGRFQIDNQRILGWLRKVEDPLKNGY